MLLIALAFEWIALITLLAPILLTGRFRSKPNLGLILWFSAFLSAGLAAVILIAALVISIFSTWITLHSNPNGTELWWQALLAGFGPWLFLALAGISLALMNLRLSPLLESARETSPLAQLSSQLIEVHKGFEVRLVELPIDHAFTDGRAIFITRQLWFGASEARRQQILAHELIHIRMRHPLMLRIVQFIETLTPKFAASRALQSEVLELTELVAIRAEKSALSALAE